MIWCVEDDSSIRDIEVYALTSTGFEAKGFEDGDSFWNALQSEKPELIVLDVMLPGKDGVTLLKMMKQTEEFQDIPVIMATAKGTEYDKIQSLDLGADDYLVKPFAFEELLARVRVIIRKNSVSNSNVISVADLTVDISSRKVTRNGKDISLSAKEYELLQYLAVNNGIVLSREKIEDHIWNYDYEGGTNVVDVYIRYLRKKIDDGYDKKLIHTVRGMGYVLREEK